MRCELRVSGFFESENLRDSGFEVCGFEFE